MCNGKVTYHGLIIQRNKIKYRCAEDKTENEGCCNCVFKLDKDAIDEHDNCEVDNDDRFQCSPYYHFVKVKPKESK